MATGTVMRSPDDAGTYTYSSQPHTVRERNKYRDQDIKPSNIMHDRRIVRGNTYAITSLPANTQKAPTKIQQQQHQEREAATHKRIRHHMRQTTPPAVDGRRHTEVQTELYLEEITDRVEEADIQTQTDAFLDRPPTPLFIPAKTGTDSATQIEEGDLFDFDLEVKPILEVLIGKTVEQALLEVMEEEELSALREQQHEFEENRNSELIETQRLEEQERRRKEEKERRMDQQRRALIKEKETAEKIAARAFAQSYLADLVPAVFTTLVDHGFFYDRVERDVETDIMPWLLAETKKIMDKKIVARLLLDAMIRIVVKKKLGISTPSSSPQPTETPIEDGTVPTAAESKEMGAEKEKKEEAKAEPSADSDTVPPSIKQTQQGKEGEEGTEKKKKEEEETGDAKPKEEGASAESGDTVPETGDETAGDQPAIKTDEKEEKNDDEKEEEKKDEEKEEEKKDEEKNEGGEGGEQAIDETPKTAEPLTSNETEQETSQPAAEQPLPPPSD